MPADAAVVAAFQRPARASFALGTVQLIPLLAHRIVEFSGRNSNEVGDSTPVCFSLLSRGAHSFVTAGIRCGGGHVTGIDVAAERHPGR